MKTKNKKIKLFDTDVGCDLINMCLVLDEVRKMKITAVYNARYDQYEGIEIHTFSTCRSEGFAIFNYGFDKCVVFSNVRGGDDIRVFSGRPSDFEDKEGKHDMARNWSHGLHSYSGPWNPRVWDTVREFHTMDRKKAAEYIVKQLNTRELPSKKTKRSK